MKNFEFEPPESQLNTTADSESSFVDADFAGMSEGKLMFAECDTKYKNPLDMTGLNKFEVTAKHLSIAEDNLFCAWKLAVSYPDLWMQDVDGVTKQTLLNLTKLVDVMLNCPGLDQVLSRQKNIDTSAQNPRLFTVINTYRKAMELLRFDIINKHLMTLSLKFVHRTLNLILNSRELQVTDRRIKTLSGSYALLKFTESMLNRVYTWVPKDMTCTGLPPDSGYQRQIYEPAILLKSQMSPRSLAREITLRDGRKVHDMDHPNELPSRK